MALPKQTSVLIVGAGPAGLTLANLLGTEGVETLLIERNPGCVPEPRAVAIDGESMRTLQAASLAETVRATIREGFVADYLNGEGDTLFTNDLTPRPYGFCLQNSFDQPTLERQLLDGLARFSCVTVMHNTELVEFSQNDFEVKAILQTDDGESHQLSADYMVGCDGGRSSIRQALGITMQGDRLPQKWLVVDTIDPHLGSEPACRFYCDPRRPAMTIIRPGSERRWEWMLVGDESEEEMLDDNRIAALLAEHTDPEQVQVYRKCVYSFSAVVAERFSEGRIFLAGDAAHMTPPFAGQGLNAGIRDVRNLSWKLAAVLGGSLPRSLLATYNQERRNAARAVIDLAVALGDQIQPTDQEAAAQRDAFFAELNADPVQAKAFAAESIAPLSDVRLMEGWFTGEGTAGRMLPQPHLAAANGVTLLDDFLGKGFTAILIECQGLPAGVSTHPLWQSLSPSLHYMDGGEDTLPRSTLAEFRDGDSPVILLVRPDRFVMAEIPMSDAATATLDSLQRLLAGP